MVLGRLASVVPRSRPVSVAGTAHPVLSSWLHVGVLRREVMPVLATGLRRVASRPVRIHQWRDRLKMSRVYTVPMEAATLSNVIQFQPRLDGADKQLPHQTVAERSLPLPVSKGVAILPNWEPQPTAGLLGHGDLSLESFRQLGEKVHS